MSRSRFEKLVSIMARLRGPGGCPWDREQTLETLRRYLIEETYEVIDAIDRGDPAHLAEELGDLQLQIVFQAQIAGEQGEFTIDDVLDHINEKLVRRHPHVFGDESAATAGEVLTRWNEIKAEEKRRKAEAAGSANGDESASILDEIPRSQPALLEAHKIGKKAAASGFEWRGFDELLAKLAEEADELREAADGDDRPAIEDEVGDLLFMAVNIARYLRVDPELALRRANGKFRRRFASIEDNLRERGKSLETSDIGEMERLWLEAKTK